ncbi:MAG: hypothetical protein ACR2RF_14840 [Geminicoccaceae bacterium]
MAKDRTLDAGSLGDALLRGSFETKAGDTARKRLQDLGGSNVFETWTRHERT